MSPLMASQLPSKAKPIKSPLAFITGLPEFPPVMSVPWMKHTTKSPRSLAYGPKSRALMSSSKRSGTTNSGLLLSFFSKMPLAVVTKS